MLKKDDFLKGDFEILVWHVGDALVWTPYTDEKGKKLKLDSLSYLANTHPVKMKMSEYSDYAESKRQGLADR